MTDETYTWEDYYDFMVDNEIATGDELGMAIYFGGCNFETMKEALFFLTGCRSIAEVLE